MNRTSSCSDASKVAASVAATRPMSAIAASVFGRSPSISFIAFALPLWAKTIEGLASSGSWVARLAAAVATRESEADAVASR